MSKKSNTSELKRLRRQIDRCDRELLKNLAQRFKIVKKIAQVKDQMGTEPRQKSRWVELMRARLSLAKKLHLQPRLVRLIFEGIQVEAIAQQASHMRVSSQRARRRK